MSCCHLEGGHSDGSGPQRNDCSMSSELLNHWQPNFVYWYSIMHQCCAKSLDYCLQGKCHSKDLNH